MASIALPILALTVTVQCSNWFNHPLTSKKHFKQLTLIQDVVGGETAVVTVFRHPLSARHRIVRRPNSGSPHSRTRELDPQRIFSQQSQTRHISFRKKHICTLHKFIPLRFPFFLSVPLFLCLCPLLPSCCEQHEVRWLECELPGARYCGFVAR